LHACDGAVHSLHRVRRGHRLFCDLSREVTVGQIAQTFGVDWPHLTAQMISFSIVCALLYRFAYTPVLAMLAKRRELIGQGLANTEKINAALAAVDVQREEILSRARDDAAHLIDQGLPRSSARSTTRSRAASRRCCSASRTCRTSSRFLASTNSPQRT